jgi:hypothetical protein
MPELANRGLISKAIVTGGFFLFFYVLHSTLLHLPPLRCTVSEDDGIEPRTVAALALAIRRSTL